VLRGPIGHVAGETYPTKTYYNGFNGGLVGPSCTISPGTITVT
jgi:hypothetical protein